MKWNEILTIWFFFQVGNLIAFMAGASEETAINNLFFSGLFAFYIAGLQYFKSRLKNGN